MLKLKKPSGFINSISKLRNNHLVFKGKSCSQFCSITSKYTSNSILVKTNEPFNISNSLKYVSFIDKRSIFFTSRHNTFELDQANLEIGDLDSIDSTHQIVNKKGKAIKKQRKDAAPDVPIVINPMDKQTKYLIAQLESNYLQKKKVGDPQDIERLYCPTSKLLSTKEFELLRKKIIKSFTSSQIRTYIESHPHFHANFIHVKKTKKNLSNWTKSSLVLFIFDLWKLEVYTTPKRSVDENKVVPEFITEEVRFTRKIMFLGLNKLIEYQSNKREIYFLVNKGGENLRRLELLGNSAIEVNLEDETYIIRGDPSEIAKTRQLFDELLSFQTIEIEISSIFSRDPHFLYANEELLTGIAQVAGTYITAESSTRGHFLKISGLKYEDIVKTQRLLDSVWEIDHHISPRSVFYHLSELTPNPGYGLFPSSDPVYLPEFYQTMTLFHLRPQLSLSPLSSAPKPVEGISLVSAEVDARLTKFFDKPRHSFEEIASLLSQAAAHKNFGVELEASFGQFLLFDRSTLNQPGFFHSSFTTHTSEEACRILDKTKSDMYFLPSFPQHKVWETLVPLEEKTTVELEFRCDISLSNFWESVPAPETVDFESSFKAFNVSYGGLQPAIKISLKVDSSQKYCFDSAHFTYSPIYADLVLPSQLRSIRLTSQAQRPIYNICEKVLKILESGRCSGQMLLPSINNSQTLYRLISVKRQVTTLYPHPYAHGRPGHCLLELSSICDPKNSAPVAKIKLHPSSLDQYSVNPYAPFVKDISDLCQY